MLQNASRVIGPITGLGPLGTYRWLCKCVQILQLHSTTFFSLSRSLSLSNLKLRPPRRKLRQERSKQKQHFRSSPPPPRLVPAGRYPAKHDGKVQAEGREEHGQSDFAASSLVHPHVGLCRCRRTAVMQLRSVLCIADHCRLWMRASIPLTVPDRSGGQSCAW